MYLWVLGALLPVAWIAFLLGRRRAVALSGGDLLSLHSRPHHHGLAAAARAMLAGIAVFAAAVILFEWQFGRILHDIAWRALPNASGIEHDLLVYAGVRLATGDIAEAGDPVAQAIAARHGELAPLRLWGVGPLVLLAAVIALVFTLRRIAPQWKARNQLEQLIRGGLWVCAGVAVLTTVGIVLSLLGETLRFFADIPFPSFLFGLDWAPLAGVFEGRLNPDRIGAVPLFAGTAMITAIAILIAAPIGLMAAIYLSEFASARLRFWAKPTLEILAGIPTVVYGFFAALTVAPFLRDSGGALGLSVASESALAAGLVMGIMIIPFISSLSDDVINAVPQTLRDGSLALGATKAETVQRVILPAALPGIASAVLLGISRAVGETMIVVMAAGQGANLTANPLEAVTTVTVQIVALITGDTEAETAAGPAFALGFTLFLVTLALNVVALRTVRKYREAYE